MRGVNAAVVWLLGAALEIWLLKNQSGQDAGGFRHALFGFVPPDRLAGAAAGRRRHQRARRYRPCADRIIRGVTHLWPDRRSNDTLPGFQGMSSSHLRVSSGWYSTEMLYPVLPVF